MLFQAQFYQDFYVIQATIVDFDLPLVDIVFCLHKASNCYC